MGTQLISDERMAEALLAAHGKLAVAAAALGCSRQTVWRRLRGSGDLQAIVEDEREGMIDLAESKLYDAIEKGQAWAICFCLKTVGKSRGYVERQEVEHSGETAMRVAGLSRDEIKLEIANRLGLGNGKGEG